MTQIHEWKGATGRRYCFQVHALPLRKPFTQPGVYLFCRQTTYGWEAVDVGQAESLTEACSGTPVRFAAEAAGATHLHVHIRLAGFEARVEEEGDLREALFPLRQISAA
jgi:hypothetical protein